MLVVAVAVEEVDNAVEAVVVAKAAAEVAILVVVVVVRLAFLL